MSLQNIVVLSALIRRLPLFGEQAFLCVCGLSRTQGKLTSGQNRQATSSGTEVQGNFASTLLAENLRSQWSNGAVKLP
jgi:hypothetical protein